MSRDQKFQRESQWTKIGMHMPSRDQLLQILFWTKNYTVMYLGKMILLELFILILIMAIFHFKGHLDRLVKIALPKTSHLIWIVFKKYFR